MTTKATSLIEEKPFNHAAQPRLSRMLRELLPLGAVISTNNYVQVLMLDNGKANDKDLPAHFGEQLCTIHFISHVIVAAQAAQERYGVPAPVLIAKSMYDCGWGCDPLMGKGDFFGDKSPRVQRRRPYTLRETRFDFLREARRISHHSKHHLASRSNSCLCEYIARLSRYGVIRDPRAGGADAYMYALDLIANVVNYQLWNCDSSQRKYKVEPLYHGDRERAYDAAFDQSVFAALAASKTPARPLLVKNAR